MELTREQKINWLRNASNEELLRQLVSLERNNNYGVNNEDIILTRTEILNRMEG